MFISLPLIFTTATLSLLHKVYNTESINEIMSKEGLVLFWIATSGLMALSYRLNTFGQKQLSTTMSQHDVINHGVSFPIAKNNSTQNIRSQTAELSAATKELAGAIQSNSNVDELFDSRDRLLSTLWLVSHDNSNPVNREPSVLAVIDSENTIIQEEPTNMYSANHSVHTMQYDLYDLENIESMLPYMYSNDEMSSFALMLDPQEAIEVPTNVNPIQESLEISNFFNSIDSIDTDESSQLVAELNTSEQPNKLASTSALLAKQTILKPDQTSLMNAEIIKKAQNIAKRREHNQYATSSEEMYCDVAPSDDSPYRSAKLNYGGVELDSRHQFMESHGALNSRAGSGLKEKMDALRQHYNAAQLEQQTQAISRREDALSFLLQK